MKQIQEINSLRLYSTIYGNRLSVEIPKIFSFREVEVIIVPIEMKPISNNTVPEEDWKNDFVSISRWDISEDEIKIK
ncbi:MAG: hypothetical protein HQK79_09590 [Desulfobacterales bacterium]|nr:hypothetical protein [Desulfobacterales bacterium]MBF0397704.1 hypothetical protein [Desulfobacterales bacterium]